jgi:gliding-associated putative ABC transporter substrate-binding component GldG
MATKRTNRGKDLLDLGIGLAIVALVLFISSFVRLRADLTSEGRYTLTPSTHELVGTLDDVVFVKVYLHGELPADLGRLEQSTRELLDEMRVLNPDKLQYEFVDPSASTDEKTRTEVYGSLEQQGLSYTSVRTKEKAGQRELIVFPGAILSYKGKSHPLQLLKTQLRAPDADMVNRSINNLEYELSSAIRQVTSRNKPRVAFLEGHGELAPPQVQDLANVLGEQYTVSRVRIDDRIDALSDKVEGGRYRANRYEALVIAAPDSAFSQRDQYVIDQFVMNGGKVLWLVDAMNANLDSLRENQFSMATPLDLGIDELLFAYGVRINKDLVLDQSCAPIEIYTQPYGNQRKLERFPWYFEPVLIPQAQHPIVSNIDPVHLRFASTLDTIGTDSVKKTILLTTSPRSYAQRNPVRVSLNIVEMDMGFEKRSTPHMPVAVLLEGPFTSAYKDRLPPNFTQDPTVGYREQGKRTAQLVISDGDVIVNRVDPAKGMYYMLGFDRYANAKIYGNRELLMNAMNYLLDDQSLISIRSRTITLRQLDAGRIVEDRLHWQLVNTVVPVALSILIGILFNLMRRRRANAPKAN